MANVAEPATTPAHGGGDTSDDAFGQIFVASRPPKKKINKALRSFNKRVSHLGASISRSTGIVDVGDSDSGASEHGNHVDDYFYDEDGMLKYDSELRIVHDSLVPTSDDLGDENHGSHYSHNRPLHYGQQQYHDDESQQMLRAQRREMQLQRKREEMQRQWAASENNKQIQKRRRKVSGTNTEGGVANKPPPPSSIASFDFVPQKYHHNYRKQQYLLDRERARERELEASARPDDTATHTHIRMGPSTKTYFSYYDDELREEQRKKEALRKEKERKSVWKAYIDTEDDQANDIHNQDNSWYDDDLDGHEYEEEDNHHHHKTGSAEINETRRIPTPDGSFRMESPRTPERDHEQGLEHHPPQPQMATQNSIAGKALSSANNVLFDQSMPVSKYSAKALLGKLKKKPDSAPVAVLPPPPSSQNGDGNELFEDSRNGDHEERTAGGIASSSVDPPSPSKSPVKSISSARSASSNHSASVRAGSPSAVSHHSGTGKNPASTPPPLPYTPSHSPRSRRGSPSSNMSATSNKHSKTSRHSRASHRSKSTPTVPEAVPQSPQSDNSNVTNVDHGAELYKYWLSAKDYVSAAGAAGLLTWVMGTNSETEAGAAENSGSTAAEAPTSKRRTVVSSPGASGSELGTPGSIASGKSRAVSSKRAAAAGHSPTSRTRSRSAVGSENHHHPQTPPPPPGSFVSGPGSDFGAKSITPQHETKDLPLTEEELAMFERELTDKDDEFNSDDEYGAKEQRRKKFKQAMKYVFQKKGEMGSQAGSMYSGDEALSTPHHPPASALYDGESMRSGAMSMRSGHSRHTVAPTVDNASVHSSGRQSHHSGTKKSIFSKRSGSQRPESVRSMSDGVGIYGSSRPPSARSVRSSTTVPRSERPGTIGEEHEYPPPAGGPFGAVTDKWNELTGGVQPVVSNFVDLFRSTARLSFILRPVDAVADAVPSLQNAVVIVELILLMWILYQVSIVIETMATFVKTLCMPVIFISRALGFKS